MDTRNIIIARTTAQRISSYLFQIEAYENELSYVKDLSTGRAKYLKNRINDYLGWINEAQTEISKCLRCIRSY